MMASSSNACRLRRQSIVAIPCHRPCTFLPPRSPRRHGYTNGLRMLYRYNTTDTPSKSQSRRPIST
jgi:hypothetical protein